MSDWQPIESAPKECAPILGAGVHRRADRGDPLVVDIIYWVTDYGTKEVPLGNDLFRRERYVIQAGWVRRGDVGNRPLDFEPDYWMPLPAPPKG